MDTENPRERIGGNNPPPLKDILAEQFADLGKRVEALADRANAGPKKIKTAEDLETVVALTKDARALVKEADDARKVEKEPHLTAGREIDAFFGVFTDRIERIRKAFQKIADDHAAEKAAEERRKRQEEARKAQEAAEREAEKARKAQEAGRQATADRAADRAERFEQKADEATAAAQASAADLTRTRTAAGTASARTEWDFEITDYDAIPLDKLRPYFKREEVEKAIRSHVRIQKGSASLPGVRVFESVKANIR